MKIITWSGMSSNCVLTAVQTMLVLLLAAKYDNYNSVTTGLVTERRSCSVPSNTLLRIDYSQDIFIATQSVPTHFAL
jgi:hypothetical protein